MKHLKAIAILSLSMLLMFTACVPTPPVQPTTPVGRITEPADKAQVEKLVTVSGTSKNIAADSKIWIVVKINKANRYYPQNTPVDVLNDGRWTSEIVIGQDNEPGLAAKIYLVAANVETQNAFTDYLKNAKDKTDFSGLENLPDSAVNLDMINVVRK